LKEWQPDLELRLKHILENMIYVCELLPKNMIIYLKLFNPENKHKLNFHIGSFLDEGFSEVMKEWGVEKFDIVVGNPPYNGNKKNLYVDFFDKGINLCKNILLYVTPSRYVIQPEYGEIRNKIEKLTKNVYLKNVGRIFKDVSFSVVINRVDIKNKKINILNWLDGIGDDIIKKILSKNIKKLNTYRSRPLLKNKKEYNLYPDIPFGDNNIKYYINTKAGKNTPFRYLDKKIGETFKPKIICTEFVGTSNKKTLGYPIIDKYGEIGLGSDSCMYIYEDSEIKLNKYYNYFTSKIMKYILTKICQSSHANQTMRLLPDVIDEIVEVNDEKLYNYFNLTPEEIQLIEETISEPTKKKKSKKKYKEHK
jgi:hypothetical protein